MEPIAVTGMGVVSPLGSNIPTLWNNLTQGISGIQTLDTLAGLPVTMGGPAQGFDPARFLGAKELRQTDRYAQMALIAGLDALKLAGLEAPAYAPERTGVLVGTGAGGMASLESQVGAFVARGARRVSPLTVPMFIANMASGLLAMRTGFRGPGMGLSSACASGGHALAIAARLIQCGDADCMLAGGVEACLTPFAVSAFAAMRALSTRNDEPQRASRPFDRERDGFVMGEGGAVFVLERPEAARARGARILGLLQGIGQSQDAYHMVAPDPEGRAVVAAMEAALRDAGLDRTDIGYINAHGTSTPLNDPTETRAIKAFFGAHASRLKVSSTKSMTGHLIGGAAALESAICLLALKEGLLPPTINLEHPDAECDLDYVAATAVSHACAYCMNNAFGFGGQNVVLVFGKDSER